MSAEDDNRNQNLVMQRIDNERDENSGEEMTRSSHYGTTTICGTSLNPMNKSIQPDMQSHQSTEDTHSRDDINQVNRSQAVITFPMKLHQLLQDASQNGYDHIISWQEHGRSFQIRQRKDFVKTILPQ
jgi:HSF-type DNA-binding